MADRLIRALVTLPRVTAIPKDAVQNVWHFDDDDDPIASWDDTIGWVMSALSGFYQAIDAYLASTLGTEATVRIYDMRDPEPRVPKAIETFTITPAVASALPAEVAQCLSFKAANVSGTNPARRRGRVYLGPLAATGMSISGGDARPSGDFGGALFAAAATLIDGVAHPGSPGLHLKWAIYSPTTDATASIDEAFHDVVEAWYDNTFDTQRRRGTAPTARGVIT